MENFLTDNAILIVVGCALLCGVGILLFLGLQLLEFAGAIIGAIIGIFELFLGVLGGGPVAWCGCLLVLLVIVSCAGIVFLLATSCGTENAINLCSVFGL